MMGAGKIMSGPRGRPLSDLWVVDLKSEVNLPETALFLK